MKGLFVAAFLGFVAICACSSSSNNNCTNIAGTWNITGGTCVGSDTCTVTQSGCSATFTCASGTVSKTGSATSGGFSFNGTTSGNSTITCSGSVTSGSFSGNCNSNGQSCTVSGNVVSSSGSDGGSCTASSQSCTQNGQCCSFQSGKGYCVDFGSGGLCADACSTNSDCVSGCCATTQMGHQVCGPASACGAPPNDGGTCVATGNTCTANGDCCDFQQSKGYCATFGGVSACHDSCAQNADCQSGCCAPINNGSSVCAASSFCGPASDGGGGG